jgi:WD40 repeat protein
MINISKSNIHTINELGFLGRGSIECLAWTPEGQTLAVSARVGIWLYNLKQPQQAPNLLYTPKLVAGFIAIHPGGELLAVNDTSSDDLYIWDLKKNEVISVLEEYQKSINQLFFTSDGKFLVSAGTEPEIFVWDMQASSVIVKLPSYQSTYAYPKFISASPDGRYLAYIGHDSLVHIWDLSINQELVTFPKNFRVLFGNDGILFVGVRDNDKDAQAELLSIAAEKNLNIQPVIHQRDITIISVGPTNQTVIGINSRWDYSIFKLSYKTDETQSIPHNGKQGWENKPCIAQSTDHTLLAFSSAHHVIRVWDMHKFEERALLRGHKWGAISHLTINPQKTLLASGSHADHTVRVWDIEKKKQKYILKEFTSSLKCIKFSPDGTKLASGGLGDTVKLWDIKTNTQIFEVWGRGDDWVDSLSFSPDGTKLAISHSRNVHLYDTDTGEEIFIIRIHKKRRQNKGFHGIKKIITVFYQGIPAIAVLGKRGGSVSIWDWRTGEEITVLENKQKYADYNIAANTTGDFIIIANSRELQIWDMKTGTQKATIEKTNHVTYVNSLALNQKGNLVAIGSVDIIELWDIEKQKLLHSLTKDCSIISSVAFSPDGDLLASTGHFDTYVRIWDTTTGMEVYALPHHNSLMSQIEFSPHGNLLAMANGVVVRLWGVSSKTKF